MKLSVECRSADAKKEIFFIRLIQSLGKNGGEDLDISKMVLFCKENSPSCPFKTDDKIAGSFAGGAARPWLNLPVLPYHLILQ